MADLISIIKREKKIVSAVLILFGLSMIISGVSYAIYFLNLLNLSLSSTEAFEQINLFEPLWFISNILLSAANLAAGILLVVLGKKILK